MHDIARILPSVFRFCHLLTGDATTAESVTRRVFAAYIKRGIDSGEFTSPRVWLFGRAREMALQQAIVDHLPIPDKTEALHPSQLETLMNFDKQRLPAILGAMPEPMRTALALFTLGDFSATEVATLMRTDLEELALTLAAARVMLHERISTSEVAQ